MTVLAFCPRCGKQQECFDDVPFKNGLEAYKFVCDCMTVVRFHFPETMDKKRTQTNKANWLIQDIKVLRG